LKIEKQRKIQSSSEQKNDLGRRKINSSILPFPTKTKSSAYFEVSGKPTNLVDAFMSG